MVIMPITSSSSSARVMARTPVDILPIEKYRRTYSFPTVSTDADGGKSVQPKFYYTGDFNGDGKVEIMAVSSHQPFGDKGKPSQCYVFDLLKNKILYQGHVFPFNVEFVGTHQDDAKVAANHTDKLLVIDYDGDGKSDICHIDENKNSTKSTPTIAKSK